MDNRLEAKATNYKAKVLDFKANDKAKNGFKRPTIPLTNMCDVLL